MGTRTFLFLDRVGSTEQLTGLGDAVAESVRRALFDTLRRLHTGELAGRDMTEAEWDRFLPGRPYRRTCSDR